MATLNDLIDDLKQNLFDGIKIPVLLMGTTKLQKPLPCILVVPSDGDADYTKIQVWVRMLPDKGDDLRRFMAEQLPWLLSLRKNHYKSSVWKYRNYIDREIFETEGQQNYIKMGIEIRVPKLLIGASWNIG